MGSTEKEAGAAARTSIGVEGLGEGSILVGTQGKIQLHAGK